MSDSGYYDERARARAVADYVHGNERIRRQCELLAAAVAPASRDLLVVGIGASPVARFLARKVAPGARVLAIDMSAESIRFARQLFPHPRVRYEPFDVLTADIEGRHDVVVLPDVYEHVRPEDRALFHRKLEALLAERSTLVVTVPSPGLQRWLGERGELQPVDESIDLTALLELARSVGGSLTYYAHVSVWRTDDYLHAVIERGEATPHVIGAGDRVTLKRGRQPGPFAMALARTLAPLARLARRLLVRARLGSW